MPMGRREVLSVPRRGIVPGTPSLTPFRVALTVDAIAKGKMEPRMTGEAADDWCVRHGNEGGHLEDLDDCPGMHWDKCKKMWMDEGATALGKHLREDHDMRD